MPVGEDITGTKANIDKELSVLKEKNRVTKEEISKNDKRQQYGVTMIEKAKDKMRGEGGINELTLALADKITAFHKVHTQANDKLSE